MEQSLLGTGWQLLNLAFYFFCLVQSACKKKTDGAQAGSDSETDSGLEFWDIAAGADKVQKTMKENGWAFEIGYYYAVGLVIFAIVIFYSSSGSCTSRCLRKATLETTASSGPGQAPAPMVGRTR